MAKVKTFRRVEIPPLYSSLVGLVAFHWATIEHELVDIIGEAMGIGPKERRIMMSKMDPKAKFGMLRVIGSKFVKGVQLRQRMNKLCGYCDSYYDLRNMFVHGAWTYPAGHPEECNLQVIDSGETAHLPGYCVISPDEARLIVNRFSELLAYSRKVLGEVRAERKRRSTKPDDDDSGVMCISEVGSSLVIPQNLFDGPE